MKSAPPVGSVWQKGMFRRLVQDVNKRGDVTYEEWRRGIIEDRRDEWVAGAVRKATRVNWMTWAIGASQVSSTTSERR